MSTRHHAPEARTRVRLLETPNLVVLHVPHPSAACVVTFGNYVDVPTEQPKGFGEAFLDQHGIDAVHVVGRGNDWYQYDEMPEVLAAIRAAVGGDRRVLTYGSSMGGYAALRFAGALGAAGAIAISPQYSLDPEAVPFERRWRPEARRIRFRPWPDDHPPPGIVFYDPHGPDRLHVDLWSAGRDLVRVAIPYAEHPAATFLAETGLLGSTVLDIVADRFDPASLLREARKRRRQSGKYWITLARQQPAGRRGLALRLAHRAVQAQPLIQDYASTTAMMLYRAGEYAAAEQLHARALARAPEDPVLLFRSSLFLTRMGRFDDALALARHAAGADPASLPLRRHARQLAAIAGLPLPLLACCKAYNAGLRWLTRTAWRRGGPVMGRLAHP